MSIYIHSTVNMQLETLEFDDCGEGIVDITLSTEYARELYKNLKDLFEPEERSGWLDLSNKGTN